MDAYEGYVYLLQAEGFPDLFKIGFSRNVNVRVSNISRSLPFDVKLVHSFYARWGLDAEATLKNKYTSKRIKGEWYHLSSEDVESIKMEGQDGR